MNIKNITEEDVWNNIPYREEDSHKGTYGKLLIAAGSYKYRGAAALAAEGALRSGCGIVTLASIEPVFNSIQARLPECICFPCSINEAGGIAPENYNALYEELSNGYTCLLMGPGMGNTDDTCSIVLSLVSSARCSVVLDADALNACSSLPELPHPAEGSLIITPHPGEMARLTGTDIPYVKAHREELSLSYAAEHNCIVVLKEHRTLIAFPDGALWRNTTGCSGLARGGSGDILAGMIGSLTAQNIPPEYAALCGVWLHGEAADRYAAEHSLTGMLPHDIFRSLQDIYLENGR